MSSTYLSILAEKVLQICSSSRRGKSTNPQISARTTPHTAWGTKNIKDHVKHKCSSAKFRVLNPPHFSFIKLSIVNVHFNSLKEFVATDFLLVLQSLLGELHSIKLIHKIYFKQTPTLFVNNATEVTENWYFKVWKDVLQLHWGFIELTVCLFTPGPLHIKTHQKPQMYTYLSHLLWLPLYLCLQQG